MSSVLFFKSTMLNKPTEFLLNAWENKNFIWLTNAEKQQITRKHTKKNKQIMFMKIHMEVQYVHFNGKKQQN